MTVSVRLLRQGEERLANDMFNRIYHSDRSIEDFEWEFIKGPFGKSIYVVAVESDGDLIKIIGIQCAIPMELVRNGEVLLTAKSEDTLIDPSFRGMRIFEKMFDLLFEDL